MHFDYCTTASLDFVLLDQATFSDILEVCFLLHHQPFFSYNNLSTYLGTKKTAILWENIVVLYSVIVLIIMEIIYTTFNDE